MAKQKAQFFVYVIKDGAVPLYVGKGTGNRHKRSARLHGGDAHIIEWCKSDDHAFERERHWIAELRPENNKCPGGNGGRVKAHSRYKMPKLLKGVISQAQWKQTVDEQDKQLRDMELVGARRYVARFLCDRLSEANCEQWGVSIVGLNRLREVAHG